MRKIHYLKEGSETTIVSPAKTPQTPIWIEEIGHSIRPAGYESTFYISRNSFALHFVLQGEGEYNGNPIKAPMSFLMQSGTPHFYSVSKDQPSVKWEHYWMLFSGSEEFIIDFLEFAGLSAPTLPLSASCTFRVRKIFEELMSPSHYVNVDDNLTMLAGFYQILALNKSSLSEPVQGSPTNIEAVVEKICELVHEKYAEPLRNEDFASAVHLSIKYLIRIFNEKTGITPMQYLTSYRIQCAKKLLESSTLSINEIANAVGYKDPNYFCSAFRKHCDGLSPSAYRNRPL